MFEGLVCAAQGGCTAQQLAAAARGPLHSCIWCVPAPLCGSPLPAQLASSCALTAGSPEAHSLAARPDRSCAPVIAKLKWPLS